MVNGPLSKRQTYKSLGTILNLLNKEYTDDDKNSVGIIRRIIGNGDGVRMAIANARELALDLKERGLIVVRDIQQMNPYTTMHELMEPILAEMQKADRVG